MGNIVSKALIVLTLIVIFQAYETISASPRALVLHAGLNKTDKMLAVDTYGVISNFVEENHLARHFIETYLNLTLPREPLCTSTRMEWHIKCDTTSETVVEIRVECIQSLLNFSVFLFVWRACIGYSETYFCHKGFCISFCFSLICFLFHINAQFDGCKITADINEIIRNIPPTLIELEVRFCFLDCLVFQNMK